MDAEKNTSNNLQNLRYKFDTITSRNGKDWLLALNWILVLELLSTILEYNLVQKAQNFVEPLNDGLLKELSIAFLIVVFIWYTVYNIIFMHKEKFLLFTLYISICIYLLFTNDLSFNLLLHNLNPFELLIDGFGFYMIVQIILKLTILYLIYKMLIAFRNRKENQ